MGGRRRHRRHEFQRLSNEVYYHCANGHNHRGYPQFGETSSFDLMITVQTIPREGEKIRFYVQMSLDDCQLTPDGRVDKSYLSSEAARHKVMSVRPRYLPRKSTLNSPL